MPLRQRDKPAPARQQNTLTAAAYRVPLANRDQVARLRRSREDTEWQTEAWEFFDAIGEVKQSITLMGNLLGKLRLYAGVREVPDEAPVPIADSDLAQYASQADDALARLHGPFGGHSVILAVTNMNFDVAGECFLVGRAARDNRDEEWAIKSVDEVNVDSDSAVKVEWDDTGKAEPLNEDEGDSIIRLWIRHPRRSWRPDSPLHGVLGDCDLVLTYKAAKRAEGLGRCHNGMLKVPEELDPQGPADPTQDTGDGESGSKLLDDFLAYVGTAISDPGSAAAVAPYFLMGKGELLDQVKWEPMTRDFSPVVEDRLRNALESVGRGLNLPIETMLGFRETTFANAFQIDQDEFDNFLDPRARLVVDAFTIGYHRPELERLGVPADAAERIEVWFDPSDLVSDPQERDNTLEAHTRRLVSDAGARKRLNIPEADAPTPEELLQRRGLDATTTELLTLMMLRLLDPSLALPQDLLDARKEAEEAGVSGNGDGAATASVPLALTAPTDDRLGRRLAEVDRSLRARLEVAVDAALSRALERAGARLRSKAGPLAASVRGVRNGQVAAHLGRSLVAQAGFGDAELLAGSWDGLEGQFDAWVAQAQADALAVLAASVTLSDEQRADVERQQTEDRGEAWAWLAAALAGLAAARLFDPAPDAPPEGELDATMSVPPGLVREAVARAGGAAGMEPGVVPMIQGGTVPAGGVATGQTLTDALFQAGGRVSGWEWDYGFGARTRAFEPHMRLDGERFVSWTSDVLANGAAFPPVSHLHPGDHAGCRCSAIPLIVVPAVGEAA